MIGVSLVLYKSDHVVLQRVVRALAAQQRRPDLIRVHANASEDLRLEDLERDLRKWAGQVETVLTSSHDNLGFSKAHNMALAALFEAGCAAVVVLNPDLVVSEECFRKLIRAEASLGSSLLGPVLELADPVTLGGTGLTDTLGVRWTRTGRHLDEGQGEPMPGLLDRDPFRVAAVSGACIYVPRSVYSVITDASGEFFDEDFFAYREDAELGLRAHLLGVECWIVPAAAGRHIRRLRGTTRGVDAQIDRLGVRNRFLLAFKYGMRRPGFPPLVLARDLLVLVAVALRERSSWSGVTEAWHLRHAMREKGRRLRLAAAERK